MQLAIGSLKLGYKLPFNDSHPEWPGWSCYWLTVTQPPPLTHLEGPLVNSGEPAAGLLEVGVLVPILPTLPWRLGPRRRLGAVGLSPRGEGSARLRLGDTLPGRQLFAVAAVGCKHKREESIGNGKETKLLPQILTGDFRSPCEFIPAESNSCYRSCLSASKIIVFKCTGTVKRNETLLTWVANSIFFKKTTKSNPNLPLYLVNCQITVIIWMAFYSIMLLYKKIEYRIF